MNVFDLIDAGDKDAQNDDRESAEALLEAGANPLLANDEGRTPADLAGDGTSELFA